MEARVVPIADDELAFGVGAVVSAVDLARPGAELAAKGAEVPAGRAEPLRNRYAAVSAEGGCAPAARIESDDAGVAISVRDEDGAADGVDGDVGGLVETRGVGVVGVLLLALVGVGAALRAERKKQRALSVLHHPTPLSR